MPRENKAEMFIRILTEMLDEERERRSSRLRLQHRANADKYMKAFRADFDHSRRRSEWFLRADRTVLVPVRTGREEPACTYSYITRNQKY